MHLKAPPHMERLVHQVYTPSDHHAHLPPFKLKISGCFTLGKRSADFAGFSFDISLFMTKLTVLMLYIFYFKNYSIISVLYTFNDHTLLQIHFN